MDAEQMKGWLELAQKYDEGLFWKHVFEDGGRPAAGAGPQAPWGIGSAKQETKKLEYPGFDLYQTEEEYLLIFEIPGVGKENVRLTLSGDTVTIRGMIPPVGEGFTLVQSERRSGSFERTVKLPQAVAEGRHAFAKHINGLLVVRIARGPQAQAAIPID